jgi:hypothetical protein
MLYKLQLQLQLPSDELCDVGKCENPVHSNKTAELCGQTFLVYLFIRFARISYRRFIAICYKFKHSTYIVEPRVIKGVEYREI